MHVSVKIIFAKQIKILKIQLKRILILKHNVDFLK